jgi:hypothetical protein
MLPFETKQRFSAANVEPVSMVQTQAVKSEPPSNVERSPRAFDTRKHTSADFLRCLPAKSHAFLVPICTAEFEFVPFLTFEDIVESASCMFSIH